MVECWELLPMQNLMSSVANPQCPPSYSDTLQPSTFRAIPLHRQPPIVTSAPNQSQNPMWPPHYRLFKSIREKLRQWKAKNKLCMADDEAVRLLKRKKLMEDVVIVGWFVICGVLMALVIVGVATLVLI